MSKRIPLGNGAAATLAVLAVHHGKPRRHVLEALLHYAASCVERPGSWEANAPFEFANYGPDGHADRWFDDERTYVEGGC